MHIGELRQAIDCVRRTAGLAAAWTSYGAVTGPITADELNSERTKLDEAVFLLVGHNVAYTGETPQQGHLIWAYQVQQMRDAVK